MKIKSHFLKLSGALLVISFSFTSTLAYGDVPLIIESLSKDKFFTLNPARDANHFLPATAQIAAHGTVQVDRSELRANSEASQSDYLWETTDLENWFNIYQEHWGVTIVGNALREQVGNILTILNDTELTLNKKAKQLKVIFATLNIPRVGMAVQRLLSHQVPPKPLHLDPRVAVQVGASSVFLVPHELLMSQLLLKGLLKSQPDRLTEILKLDKGKVQTEEFESIVKNLSSHSASKAKVSHFDDDLFSKACLVWAVILIIFAKTTGSSRAEWYEKNVNLVAQQIEMLAKKDNILLNLDGTDSDDYIRLNLAREFLYQVQSQYFKSLRGEKRRQYIEDLNRTAREFTQILKQILQEKGKSFDSLDLQELILFPTEPVELKVQSVYPVTAKPVGLNEAGEYVVIPTSDPVGEGKAQKWIDIQNSVRKSIFQIYPNLPSLISQALRQANQLVPAVRQTVDQLAKPSEARSELRMDDADDLSDVSGTVMADDEMPDDEMPASDFPGKRLRQADAEKVKPEMSFEKRLAELEAKTKELLSESDFNELNQLASGWIKEWLQNPEFTKFLKARSREGEPEAHQVMHDKVMAQDILGLPEEFMGLLGKWAALQNSEFQKAFSRICHLAQEILSRVMEPETGMKRRDQVARRYAVISALIKMLYEGKGNVSKDPYLLIEFAQELFHMGKKEEAEKILEYPDLKEISPMQARRRDTLLGYTKIDLARKRIFHFKTALKEKRIGDASEIMEDALSRLNEARALLDKVVKNSDRGKTITTGISRVYSGRALVEQITSEYFMIAGTRPGFLPGRSSPLKGLEHAVSALHFSIYALQVDPANQHSAGIYHRSMDYLVSVLNRFTKIFESKPIRNDWLMRLEKFTAELEKDLAGSNYPFPKAAGSVYAEAKQLAQKMRSNLNWNMEFYNILQPGILEFALSDYQDIAEFYSGLEHYILLSVHTQDNQAITSNEIQKMVSNFRSEFDLDLLDLAILKAFGLLGEGKRFKNDIIDMVAMDLERLRELKNSVTFEHIGTRDELVSEVGRRLRSKKLQWFHLEFNYEKHPADSSDISDSEATAIANSREGLNVKDLARLIEGEPKRFLKIESLYQRILPWNGDVSIQGLPQLLEKMHAAFNRFQEDAQKLLAKRSGMPRQEVESELNYLANLLYGTSRKDRGYEADRIKFDKSLHRSEADVKRHIEIGIDKVREFSYTVDRLRSHFGFEWLRHKKTRFDEITQQMNLLIQPDDSHYLSKSEYDQWMARASETFEEISFLLARESKLKEIADRLKQSEEIIEFVKAEPSDYYRWDEETRKIKSLPSVIQKSALERLNELKSKFQNTAFSADYDDHIQAVEVEISQFSAHVNRAIEIFKRKKVFGMRNKSVKEHFETIVGATSQLEKEATVQKELNQANDLIAQLNAVPYSFNDFTAFENRLNEWEPTINRHLDLAKKFIRELDEAKRFAIVREVEKLELVLEHVYQILAKNMDSYEGPRHAAEDFKARFKHLQSALKKFKSDVKKGKLEEMGYDLLYVGKEQREGSPSSQLMQLYRHMVLQEVKKYENQMRRVTTTWIGGKYREARLASQPLDKDLKVSRFREVDEYGLISDSRDEIIQNETVHSLTDKLQSNAEFIEKMAKIRSVYSRWRTVYQGEPLPFTELFNIIEVLLHLYVSLNNDNETFSILDLETAYREIFDHAVWPANLITYPRPDSEKYRLGAGYRTPDMKDEVWNTIDSIFKEALPPFEKKEWDSEILNTFRVYFNDYMIPFQKNMKSGYVLTPVFDEESQALQLRFPAFETLQPLEVSGQTFEPFREFYPIYLVRVSDLVGILKDQIKMDEDQIRSEVIDMLKTWAPYMQFSVYPEFDEDIETRRYDFDFYQKGEGKWIGQSIMFGAWVYLENILETLVEITFDKNIEIPAISNRPFFQIYHLKGQGPLVLNGFEDWFEVLGRWWPDDAKHSGRKAAIDQIIKWQDEAIAARSETKRAELRTSDQKLTPPIHDVLLVGTNQPRYGDNIGDVVGYERYYGEDPYLLRVIPRTIFEETELTKLGFEKRHWPHEKDLADAISGFFSRDEIKQVRHNQTEQGDFYVIEFKRQISWYGNELERLHLFDTRTERLPRDETGLTAFVGGTYNPGSKWPRQYDLNIFLNLIRNKSFRLIEQPFVIPDDAAKELIREVEGWGLKWDLVLSHKAYVDISVKNLFTRIQKLIQSQEGTLQDVERAIKILEAKRDPYTIDAAIDLMQAERDQLAGESFDTIYHWLFQVATRLDGVSRSELRQDGDLNSESKRTDEVPANVKLNDQNKPENGPFEIDFAGRFKPLDGQLQNQSDRRSAFREFFYNSSATRQILFYSDSGKTIDDIQKISFDRKLGEGDHRETYLVSIILKDGSRMPFILKLSRYTHEKTALHQAVGMRARRVSGLRETGFGIWKMSNGETVFIRRYLEGETFRDFYLEKQSEESRPMVVKIFRQLLHIWEMTGSTISDPHPANFGVFWNEKTNDWDVFVLDLGFMIVKEGLTPHFQANGRIKFVDPQGKEVADIFQHISLDHLINIFKHRFPEPFHLIGDDDHPDGIIKSYPLNDEDIIRAILEHFPHAQALQHLNSLSEARKDWNPIINRMLAEYGVDRVIGAQPKKIDIQFNGLIHGLSEQAALQSFFETSPILRTILFHVELDAKPSDISGVRLVRELASNGHFKDYLVHLEHGRAPPIPFVMRIAADDLQAKVGNFIDAKARKLSRFPVHSYGAWQLENGVSVLFHEYKPFKTFNEYADTEEKARSAALILFRHLLYIWQATKTIPKNFSKEHVMVHESTDGSGRIDVSLDQLGSIPIRQGLTPRLIDNGRIVFIDNTGEEVASIYEPMKLSELAGLFLREFKFIRKDEITKAVKNHFSRKRIPEYLAAIDETELRSELRSEEDLNRREFTGSFLGAIAAFLGWGSSVFAGPQQKSKPKKKKVGKQKAGNKSKKLDYDAFRKEQIEHLLGYLKPGVTIDPKSGYAYDGLKGNEARKWTQPTIIGFQIEILAHQAAGDVPGLEKPERAQEALETLNRLLKQLLQDQQKFGWQVAPKGNTGLIPWFKLEPAVQADSKRIGYVDNANLTVSVMTAIGSLIRAKKMHPGLSEAIDGAIAQAKQFLKVQEIGMGYTKMIGFQNGLLRGEVFVGERGWRPDAYHIDRLFAEHGPKTALLTTYFIKLVPWTFTKLIPSFKLYKFRDGKERLVAAPWDGSAFQMGWAVPYVMRNKRFRTVYENFLKAAMDYSYQNGIPGFLSAAINPETEEYEGKIGFPFHETTDKINYTIGSLYGLDGFSPLAAKTILNWRASILEQWNGLAGPYGNFDSATAGGKVSNTYVTIDQLSSILGLIGKQSDSIGAFLNAEGLAKKYDDFLDQVRFPDETAEPFDIKFTKPPKRKRSELRAASRLVGHGKYAAGKLATGLQIPVNLPEAGEIEVDETRQAVIFFEQLGELGYVNFLEGRSVYPKLEFHLPKGVEVYVDDSEEPIDQSKFFKWPASSILYFTVPENDEWNVSVAAFHDLSDSHYDLTGHWRFNFSAQDGVQVSSPKHYRAFYMDGDHRLTILLDPSSVDHGPSGVKKELFRFASLDGSIFEAVFNPHLKLVHPGPSTMSAGRINFVLRRDEPSEQASQDSKSRPRRRKASGQKSELLEVRHALKELIREEKYSEAQDLGDRALELYPNDVSLLNYMARALAHLKETSRAHELAVQAIQEPESNHQDQLYAYQTLELVEPDLLKSISRAEVIRGPPSEPERTSSETQKSPAEIEEQIRDLLSRSMLPAAVRLAGKAVQSFPDDPFIVNFLTRQLARSEAPADWDRAQSILRDFRDLPGISQADLTFVDATLAIIKENSAHGAKSELRMNEIAPEKIALKKKGLEGVTAQEVIAILKAGASVLAKAYSRKERKLSRSRPGALVEIENAESVAVFGDLHGNTVNFTKRMRELKGDQFFENPNHHMVFVGDYLHPVSKYKVANEKEYLESLRTLLIILQWKIKYPRQVHLLPGNHDYSHAGGSLVVKRGVVQSYLLQEAFKELAKNSPPPENGLDHDFLQQSIELYLADTIRNMPLVLTISGADKNRRIAFVHAGPDKKYTRKSEINAIRISRLIRNSDRLIWDRQYDPEFLAQFLKILRSLFLISGHTPIEDFRIHDLDKNTAIAHDKQIIIDSSHKPGMLLIDFKDSDAFKSARKFVNRFAKLVPARRSELRASAQDASLVGLRLGQSVNLATLSDQQLLLPEKVLKNFNQIAVLARSRSGRQERIVVEVPELGNVLSASIHVNGNGNGDEGDQFSESVSPSSIDWDGSRSVPAQLLKLRWTGSELIVMPTGEAAESIAVADIRDTTVDSVVVVPSVGSLEFSKHSLETIQKSERVAASFRKIGYRNTLQAFRMGYRKYAKFIKIYRSWRPRDTRDYFGISYDDAVYYIENPTAKLNPYIIRSPETAKNLALAALDTIPGFKEVRLSDPLARPTRTQEMVDLYKKHVLKYSSQKGNRDGQTAFFVEQGRLNSSLRTKTNVFGKHKLYFILNLAIPEVVAEFPHYVFRNNYWVEETAQEKTRKALDSIRGFKRLRLASDADIPDRISQMAALYRKFVFGFKSRNGKGEGQRAFFRARGIVSKVRLIPLMKSAMPELFNPVVVGALTVKDLRYHLNDGKKVKKYKRPSVRRSELRGLNEIVDVFFTVWYGGSFLIVSFVFFHAILFPEKRKSEPKQDDQAKSELRGFFDNRSPKFYTIAAGISSAAAIISYGFVASFQSQLDEVIHRKYFGARLLSDIGLYQDLRNYSLISMMFLTVSGMLAIVYGLSAIQSLIVRNSPKQKRVRKTAIHKRSELRAEKDFELNTEVDVSTHLNKLGDLVYFGRHFLWRSQHFLNKYGNGKAVFDRLRLVEQHAGRAADFGQLVSWSYRLELLSYYLLGRTAKEKELIKLFNQIHKQENSKEIYFLSRGEHAFASLKELAEKTGGKFLFKDYLQAFRTYSSRLKKELASAPSIDLVEDSRMPGGLNIEVGAHDGSGMVKDNSDWDAELLKRTLNIIFGAATARSELRNESDAKPKEESVKDKKKRLFQEAKSLGARFENEEPGPSRAGIGMEYSRKVQELVRFLEAEGPSGNGKKDPWVMGIYGPQDLDKGDWIRDNEGGLALVAAVSEKSMEIRRFGGARGPETVTRADIAGVRQSTFPFLVLLGLSKNRLDEVVTAEEKVEEADESEDLEDVEDDEGVIIEDIDDDGLYKDVDIDEVAGPRVQAAKKAVKEGSPKKRRGREAALNSENVGRAIQDIIDGSVEGGQNGVSRISREELQKQLRENGVTVSAATINNFFAGGKHADLKLKMRHAAPEKSPQGNGDHDAAGDLNDSISKSVQSEKRRGRRAALTSEVVELAIQNAIRKKVEAGDHGAYTITHAQLRASLQDNGIQASLSSVSKFFSGGNHSDLKGKLLGMLPADPQDGSELTRDDVEYAIQDILASREGEQSSETSLITLGQLRQQLQENAVRVSPEGIRRFLADQQNVDLRVKVTYLAPVVPARPNTPPKREDPAASKKDPSAPRKRSPAGMVTRELVEPAIEAVIADMKTAGKTGSIDISPNRIVKKLNETGFKVSPPPVYAFFKRPENKDLAEKLKVNLPSSDVPPPNPAGPAKPNKQSRAATTPKPPRSSKLDRAVVARAIDAVINDLRVDGKVGPYDISPNRIYAKLDQTGTEVSPPTVYKFFRESENSDLKAKLTGRIPGGKRKDSSDMKSKSVRRGKSKAEPLPISKGAKSDISIGYGPISPQLNAALHQSLRILFNAFAEIMVAAFGKAGKDFKKRVASKEFSDDLARFIKKQLKEAGQKQKSSPKSPASKSRSRRSELRNEVPQIKIRHENSRRIVTFRLQAHYGEKVGPAIVEVNKFYDQLSTISQDAWEKQLKLRKLAEEMLRSDEWRPYINKFTRRHLTEIVGRIAQKILINPKGIEMMIDLMTEAYAYKIAHFEYYYGMKPNRSPDRSELRDLRDVKDLVGEEIEVWAPLRGSASNSHALQDKLDFGVDSKLRLLAGKQRWIDLDAEFISTRTAYINHVLHGRQPNGLMARYKIIRANPKTQRERALFHAEQVKKRSQYFFRSMKILGELKAVKHANVLTAVLNDPFTRASHKFKLRAWTSAIRTLGQMQARKYVPLIARYLDAGDPYLRATSARALGVMKTKRYLKRLIKMSEEDNSKTVREAAALAVNDIQRAEKNAATQRRSELRAKSELRVSVSDINPALLPPDTTTNQIETLIQDEIVKLPDLTAQEAVRSELRLAERPFDLILRKSEGTGNAFDFYLVAKQNVEAVESTRISSEFTAAFGELAMVSLLDSQAKVNLQRAVSNGISSVVANSNTIESAFAQYQIHTPNHSTENIGHIAGNGFTFIDGSPLLVLPLVRMFKVLAVVAPSEADKAALEPIRSELREGEELIVASSFNEARSELRKRGFSEQELILSESDPVSTLKSWAFRLNVFNKSQMNHLLSAIEAASDQIRSELRIAQAA